MTLYDPCCGSGYLLTVLAFLHQADLRQLIGSDIDAEAVALARRNLALTEPAGLTQRIAELETLLAQHGKQAHQQALGSAEGLRSRLPAPPLPHTLFQADILDQAALKPYLAAKSPDLVIADLPYGQQSSWQGEAVSASNTPIDRLLETLLTVSTPQTVIALVSTVKQQLAHPQYRQLGRLKVGKRHGIFLHPTEIGH